MAFLPWKPAVPTTEVSTGLLWYWLSLTNKVGQGLAARGQGGGVSLVSCVVFRIPPRRVKASKVHADLTVGLSAKPPTQQLELLWIQNHYHFSAPNSLSLLLLSSPSTGSGFCIP